MVAPQAHEVGEAVRPGSGAMFDVIARRYDLVNRILSFGLDRGWRRTAVAALELPAGARVLDVATGTADMVLEAARQATDAVIIGVDPSAAMLEVGRRKVADSGRGDRIELRRGEAENLPFGDASFDGATIAWGIRNTADRPRALAEIARITRPGGRVAILESLEASGLLLGPLIRFYMRRVVPIVGGWVSRHRREYDYLQTSVAAFPQPDEFHAMMRAAGLEVEHSRALTFGACWLFVGRRGEASGAQRVAGGGA